MRISVVIPVLDDERELGRTLAELLREPPGELETVVADGGSSDGTREVAARFGVRVVEGPRGRACQMNRGAREATGEVLLFLHGDTRIGKAHLVAAARALDDPAVSHGSFPIRLDGPGAILKSIGWLANLRTRIDRTPYGDQALFVRREAFEAVGGFPEVPLLEDVMLGRRLRSRGRFAFLPGPPALTSARRWQQDGALVRTLRNWATRALFECGVAPERLVPLYQGSAGRERTRG